MLWLGATLRAFQRDYWRDYQAVRARHAGLLSSDEAGFTEAGKRARERMDAKALVASAEILAPRGRLGQWEAQAASVALMAFGGAERALDLLLAAQEGPKSAKFELQLARALAANGLLHEAAAVLARCEAAGALPVQEALEAERRFRKQPDWTRARELVDALIALESEEQAQRVVRAALMLEPQAAKPAFKDMTCVLESGLALGVDRSALGRVIAEGLRLRPKSPDLRALSLMCGRDRIAEAEVPARGTGLERLRFAAAIRPGRARDRVQVVSELSGLCDELPQDEDIRFALACAVGQSVIDEVRPQFVPGGQEAPRFITVLPFSHEIGALMIQLREMAAWVDHFVIVEADRTLKGAPKPFNLPSRRAELEPFRSKLTYLPVSFPDHLEGLEARRFYLRDIALRALPGLCREDDYVLLTDVGEVVDRRALEGFDGDFAGLRMRTYRFFFNYGRVGQAWDRAGVIVSAGRLARYGGSCLRHFLSRFHPDWPRIAEAGWIFRGIGEAESTAGTAPMDESQSGGSERDAWAASMYAQLRRKEFEPGWTRYPLDDTFPRSIREQAAVLTPYIL